MHDRTYNLFTTNHVLHNNATSVPPLVTSDTCPYFPKNMLYNFVIVVQPESTNPLQLCWPSLSYKCLYHVHVNKTSVLFPCFLPLFMSR